MSLRYLLDTDICIYIQQNRSPNVLVRFQQVKPGEAALSVITYGELLYGAKKSHQKSKVMEQLSGLVQMLPIMALPEDAGRSYGEFRSTLEREGRIIGNNDLWIAAHAKAANLILVTNNEREFKRIRGLRMQN